MLIAQFPSSVCNLYRKYAQNAKNYEANTGKKMSFKGAEGSAESDSKEDHKASEPTATEKEDAPHKSQ